MRGKQIFVTGASRGIGAAIAREAAAQGARVALSYASRSEAADEVLKSLAGDGHFTICMDVADEDSVQKGFETVLSRFERLDGLVNNAGITQDQLLLRMKTDDFDRVVQTNLRGTFLCTRLALKPMMKARDGAVINITSVIGQMGNAGQANYAASKAGMEAFSRSVAHEVASRQIRVNCVAPGFIDTDMTGELSEAQRAAILQNVPLGRIGQGSDVAYAVCFLLSDHAKYITGHTLNVNGGLWMQ